MFDDLVLETFLKQQNKLFEQPVAATKEEAKEFLRENCAMVCENGEEVFLYLDEQMDVYDYSMEELLALEEVFSIGDGRYLVVCG